MILKSKGSLDWARDDKNYMWNTIIGHTRQVDELNKTLVEGKLPNAWLFSGMRGIGKLKVAETLAATLCCVSDHLPLKGGGRVGASPALRDKDPCGKCIGCKKVLTHVHPDVFIIEPEKQRIKIDQLRTLAQKLQLYPLEAAHKIAIVDDADTMTESAANSLLKILEEPPTATHFVLVTAAAHRLLPTIRSRCRLISFVPLAERDVADYLVRERGWSEQHALRAARLAQGSIGVACELSAPFVDGVIERFQMLQGHAGAADIIATGEMWAAETDKTALVLDVLAGWYRDRLREAVLSGNADGQTTRLINHLSQIARTRDMAETTANKQLMFEQLLFSVTAPYS